MIKSKKVNPGFIIFSFVILMFLLIPLQAQKNQITIIGTVEGFEFDEDDNVLEVAIVVPEEKNDIIEYINYIVLKKGKGLKLLEMVGETVEVTANLTIDTDGKNLIEVLKLQVITPPDMEEDIPEVDQNFE